MKKQHCECQFLLWSGRTPLPVLRPLVHLHYCDPSAGLQGSYIFLSACWQQYPELPGANYFYRERFYDFVIACVKYVKYQNPFVKKDEAWNRVNIDTLKERLSADLCRMNIGEWENKLYEILIQFEMLLEYEKRRYSSYLRYK